MFRFGPGALRGASLRAAQRHDAARDRQGLASLRRSAARPRRTHGAGHLLPALAGGGASALPRFATPEILEADLAPLALELARWGARDPRSSPGSTRRPRPLMRQARALLRRAWRARWSRTDHCAWEAMARFGAHPRLSAYDVAGRGDAAAARSPPTSRRCSRARDLGLSGAGAARGPDLRIGSTPSVATRRRPAHRHGRPAARRRAGAAMAPPASTAPRRRAVSGAGAGGLLALAYPDRIAQRRPGGGRPASARQWARRRSAVDRSARRRRLLAVAELDGDKREARSSSRRRLDPRRARS